jgi:PEP-CTERM motif
VERLAADWEAGRTRFNHDGNQILVAAFQTGNGQVIITELAAAVPEPASLALLATGLAGVAAIRCRRPKGEASRSRSNSMAAVGRMQSASFAYLPRGPLVRDPPAATSKTTDYITSALCLSTTIALIKLLRLALPLSLRNDDTITYCGWQYCRFGSPAPTTIAGTRWKCGFVAVFSHRGASPAQAFRGVTVSLDDNSLQRQQNSESVSV